jgi:DNA topoisomerase-2
MLANEVEKAEAQGLIEYFKLITKINTSNMICFDFDNKIRKYASAEEIVEEFYPIRLAYYQKRKVRLIAVMIVLVSWPFGLQDFLAGELQDQFERLTNQGRFVKMIVDKQLSVSNRKKADIVVELRKKEFRPFPKVSRARAEGETEEVVEDEEEGNDSDYDYLLGMAIWSLTKEKVWLCRVCI